MNSTLFTLLCCTCLALVSGERQDSAIEHQKRENALEVISIQNAEDRVGFHPVKIDVNVTEIEGKEAWVKVSWRGVENPQFDDWLGVLAPANAKVKHTTPVKYKLAAVASTHFDTGSGSTTFLLENHRTDMRIGFFYNGFDSPHIVAHSPVIHVKRPNMPLHGRVTLTGRPNEAVVQWTTRDAAGSRVEWGRKPGRYKHSTEARDVTYSKDDLCGGAATSEGWLDPGTFHYGRLDGLKHGHRYFYRFGSDADGFSEEFSFLAPPHHGPNSKVKILAIADMGQAEPDGANEQAEQVPSANTTRLMLEEVQRHWKKRGGYSMVGLYGDISYARGYVSQWDRFHTQTEPLVAQVPLMVAPGNHERDWPHSGSKLAYGDDSGGECGVAHERRLLMPSTRQDAPWFQYDHGPIHFVHYSTEHTFHVGSEQHAWMERALAAVDRRRTPWLVVVGHRPIYVNSLSEEEPDGDQVIAQELRDAFEGMFKDYGVDVTLHGHHHAYQRSCPLYKGKCKGLHKNGEAKGIVHMVIGNAGKSLSRNEPSHAPKIWDKLHTWWGYNTIHASRKHFTLKAFSDLDGRKFDELKLYKHRHWGKHWHTTHGEPEAVPNAGAKLWWEQDGIERPPQVLVHEQYQRRAPA